MSSSSLPQTVRSSSSSGTTSSSMHPTPPRLAINPIPSNQDIEAVIQMATSSRPGSSGGSMSTRDTRTQLFVGNLPYRVRWQDLKDLFRKAGTVLRADVSLGPDNRSRGYGTVLLATAEDAGRAIDKFNGYSWQTRTLEVRPDRIPAEFDILQPSPFHHASATATYAPQVYPFGTAGAPPPTFSEVEILGHSASVSSNLNARMLGNLASPTQLPHFPPQPLSLSLSRSVSRTGNPISATTPSNGRSLFVGNLPFQCQWQDLKDLFRQIGPVVRADVALGPDGRSRGFGTVLFQTDADADQAVLSLNGYEYNSRVLKVHHDRFTPALTGAGAAPTSPTAFTVAAPMQLPQAASFMGTSAHYLTPSHIHPQPSSFHSQPTSPFDGFPPQMTYEQYLLANVQQDVMRTQMPFELEQRLHQQILQQRGTPLPSVASSSRPSTSHSGSMRGIQRPESAASSSAVSRDGSGFVKVVDYPSLHHPPRDAKPQQQKQPDSSLDTLPPKPLHSDDLPPVTPPAKSTGAATNTTSPNHPGTITIPPPLSTFSANGVMFSPRGLPPMTPSMPGFTFHPQVSTPPGPHPHFLSPGLGPTSPPFYRNGSIHAAPGAPPMRMGSMMGMGGMFAMSQQQPAGNNMPFTPRQHMMLTPGPRLDGPPSAMVSSQQAYADHIAMYGTPYASPPVPSSGVPESRDYFPVVPVPSDADQSQKEPEEYFPPVGSVAEGVLWMDDRVEVGGSGMQSRSAPPSDTTTTSTSATGTTESAGDPTTAPSSLPDMDVRKTSSDPAATIRARVAGLALDERTMVNEIAVASGLGKGTAKKLSSGGGTKLPSLWMSQKGRFKGAPSITAPSQPHSAPLAEPAAMVDDEETKNKNVSAPTRMVLDKRDMEFDVSNPGLFGLPSPGSGRRASWGESGTRRPSAAVAQHGESDSR